MAKNPDGSKSVISRRNLLIGAGVLTAATAVTFIDKKDEVEQRIDDIKLSIEAGHILGPMLILFGSANIIDDYINFHPEDLPEDPEMIQENAEELFVILRGTIETIEKLKTKGFRLNGQLCYFLHFYIEAFRERLNGDNMHALANAARKVFGIGGNAKTLISEDKEWDDTCIMGDDVDGTMTKWNESLGDKINNQVLIPIPVPGVKVELERKDLLTLLVSLENLMKELQAYQNALDEIADPELTKFSNNETFNSIIADDKTNNVPFVFDIMEAYDKIYEAYVLQEEVAKLKKEGKPNKATEYELDLERESELYGTFVITGIINDSRYVIESKSGNPKTAKDAVEISKAVKKGLRRFKEVEKTVLDAYKQYTTTGKEFSHEDIRIFQHMLAWGGFYDYRKFNGKMDSDMAKSIARFKDVNMKASEVYDLEEKHEETDSGL